MPWRPSHGWQCRPGVEGTQGGASDLSQSPGPGGVSSGPHCVVVGCGVLVVCGRIGTVLQYPDHRSLAEAIRVRWCAWITGRWPWPQADVWREVDGVGGPVGDTESTA